MEHLLVGFCGWYMMFFMFCLIPSIVLGIIFQYLISKQTIRKFAVGLLTIISLFAGIFVNYFVLDIPIKDKIYFPVMGTIVLSTLIVSLVRSYLLKRHQCYTNNFYETFKSIMFAMFFTPAVMPIIFFSMLFSF